MLRYLTLILALIIIFTGCNNERKPFPVCVYNYAGAVGLTVIYTLHEKGMEVETNCDFSNCKRKTVYKRNFTDYESSSVANFIQSLRLDTLKSLYETKMLDGLVTKITTGTGFFEGHSITLENFETPATTKLFAYIDSLVTEKKYRFSSWGKD